MRHRVAFRSGLSPFSINLCFYSKTFVFHLAGCFFFFFCSPDFNGKCELERGHKSLSDDGMRGFLHKQSWMSNEIKARWTDDSRVVRHRLLKEVFVHSGNLSASIAEKVFSATKKKQFLMLRAEHCIRDRECPEVGEGEGEWVE